MPVLEKELITVYPPGEKFRLEETDVITPDQKTSPVVTPDVERHELVGQPPKGGQKRRPIGLILAGLGVGAIAAGSFGYRLWWV